MGWNGIGIGWPNASAQATPPLPLETYLISDCNGSYEPRWSQYLPEGTLLLGQRVPTTSTSPVQTYGLVQEIGTTFGELVAEPVENIYYNCDPQINIEISIVASESGSNINFLATKVSGTAINYNFTGSINFEGFYDITNGVDDPLEEEVYDGVAIILENHIIGEDNILATYELSIPEGYTLIPESVAMGINSFYLSPGFYNYPDVNNYTTTRTMTPEGDLWVWTYSEVP